MGGCRLNEPITARERKEQERPCVAWKDISTSILGEEEGLSIEPNGVIS